MKRDGTLTDIWDANDKVVSGVNQPKVMGNLGTNFEYKGISVGVIARYRLGGQIYNQTLVDKVENAELNFNVDKRAYYDSWKIPEIMLFKISGRPTPVPWRLQVCSGFKRAGYQFCYPRL